MSFGEFLWSLLIFYFIIFYFMLLFRVIGDLFTDKETGVVAKVAWMIFLLVAPFVSLFVYVIVRGRAMGERAMAHAQAREEAQQDYIRRTAASAVPAQATSDSASQIERAHGLMTSGAITTAEFEALKTKALASA